MKVWELLNQVDTNMENVYSKGSKIDWISDVEIKLYSEIIKEFHTDEINLVNGQDTYDLTGYDFEDIEKLTVNGAEYKKLNLLHYKPSSYFKKNGKLSLDPSPVTDVENGIEIIYRWKPERKSIKDLEIQLLLPEQFTDMYIYYIYFKICMLNNEFGKANNWVVMYNNVYEAFKKWYYKQQVNIQAEKINDKWRR